MSRRLRSRSVATCIVGLALVKLGCSSEPTTNGSSAKGGGAGAQAASGGTSNVSGLGGSQDSGIAGSNGGDGVMTTSGSAGAPASGSGGLSGASAGGATIAGNSGNGGNGGQDTWTLPPNATLASCIPANWSVKASSSADGEPPDYAIDGVPATRWSSGTGQGVGTFYEIDFGGWVTISQVVIDNSSGSGADYPRGYQILASQDGLTFPRVVTSGEVPAEPVGDVLTINFDPTPTTALQIDTTVTSGNWWSIQEMHVACVGADNGIPPPDPLLCTQGQGTAAGAAGATGADDGGASGTEAIDPFDPANWSATASSSATGDDPSLAFDGKLATRWSSGQPQAGNEWYQLDLGAIGCIGSVWIVSGGGDAAKAFTIEVSVDGVNYEQVAKGVGAPVSQLQFKPHSARFVRINQTGAGGANWWSIQELEVFH